jgi:FAD/FMN-containing dehydrogenase
METVATEKGAVTQLAEDFGGQLIQPGEPQYDEARTIYNAMIDRRPALIARPLGTADVVAAVRYAREHDLPIAVRCGGHSVAGHSVCDDGLLLDLSLLKGVHVDREKRIARAAGGVQWGEYDRETQVFGVGTPGGRALTTGVGGFTLGGGYGWISPKYGLTCDNLVSADVVTADGNLVTASERENEDLFWGLRGGGGNFGVVTSFEFRVHPVGPMILGGILAFPLEQADDAFAAYQRIVDDAPDELGTALVLLNAPPEPFVPERLHGKPVLGIAVAYCGEPTQGEKVVQPLRDAKPAVDLVEPMPYRTLQAMLEPFSPHGWRNYWRGLHLKGLSDDVLQAFLRFAPEGMAPMTFGILFQHGGAVGRVGEEESAFSHRDATFMAHPIACWADPADDERHIAWVREFTDAMDPFRTGGVYLNFMADEGEERVRAGYEPSKYDRLVALKNAYDPDNVFRFNQNIKPTAAVSA